MYLVWHDKFNWCRAKLLDANCEEQAVSTFDDTDYHPSTMYYLKYSDDANIAGRCRRVEKYLEHASNNSDSSKSTLSNNDTSISREKNLTAWKNDTNSATIMDSECAINNANLASKQKSSSKSLPDGQSSESFPVEDQASVDNNSRPAIQNVEMIDSTVKQNRSLPNLKIEYIDYGLIKVIPRYQLYWLPNIKGFLKAF